MNQSGFASFDGKMLKATKAHAKEESRLLIEQNLNEMNKKINQIQEIQSMKPHDEVDWTQAYKYWSKWEDKEDLEEKKNEEMERLQRINENSGFLGHNHDREEERRIFSLEEEEKIKLCEKHRLLGNYLFREGVYPKAAEQYKISLSYYEYCFPPEESVQDDLDHLRSICLVNLSLCHYYLGHFRASIEASSQAIGRTKEEGGWNRDLSRFDLPPSPPTIEPLQVDERVPTEGQGQEPPDRVETLGDIEENNIKISGGGGKLEGLCGKGGVGESEGRGAEGRSLLAKALYRRALSYSALDFSALEDLLRAKELQPTNHRIKEEILRVQSLNRSASNIEKEVASTMLSQHTPP